MRVLLLEDTRDVAEAIVASLARRGAAVDHAGTLAQARDALAVQDYDVAILDINLPDGSGTELLRDMRGRRDATPVLMLTARFEVEDRIAALDIGADDYLVKPFDLRELEARVRALARRATPDRGGEITFGDLAFDPAGRTLTAAGRPVALTRRELSLFEVLIANRGRVMSKERIFERMFPFDEEEVGLTAIEIYVARVRRKIEGSRVSIRTLRGLGYQLVADA
ncbi:response regulator transcription factor (plasmid) [Paroceanicella profunda]|uniref:Response regulator transcription factor n=1 Tax=Paroceanicella profunda TaxID=2579971 RepID=A0A5B8FY06_9RHOB|nr:response regulator transcription factor [Paroceanicella profunda]QDL93796.1 response regulator transcription factor [Paroceanicella profunda]